MPRYLLDADTVSYALRGHGQAAARILEHVPSDLCISSITLAELRFGAERKKSQKLRKAIRSFVKDLTVLPFDEAAAERFAEVAAGLAGKGSPIGILDTLVAAQALSRGLTVVTNNTRHFRRVPGLRVENWS
ncbi:MAG: type II toxin-antitoxin system VapC family toxin [Vicinamibacteria bacterium]